MAHHFCPTRFRSHAPLYRMYSLKLVNADRKITGSINNRDMLSRQYVFRVETSQDEILTRLERINANDNDNMEYSFDPIAKNITFTRHNVSMTYHLQITPQAGHCILRLRQQNLLHMKTNISFLVNPFMIEKLDAIPIPYFEP